MQDTLPKGLILCIFHPTPCVSAGLFSHEQPKKTQPRLESGVAPASQTKERSAHELFTGAFRNKSSM